VIDDALRGIDRGEALDPEAADWTELREQLIALREPPPQPERQSEANERGESQQSDASDPQSGQQQGGDPQSQSGGQEADSNSQENQEGGEQDTSSSDQTEVSSGNDGKSSEQSREQGTASADPESGEAGREDSGNAQEGEREEPATRAETGEAREREPVSAREESRDTAEGMVPRDEGDRSQLSEAGFGDLDDETEGERDAVAEPEAPNSQDELETEPGRRLVGGGTGDAENAALRQSFGGAVGRMESVRKQDAPAVLFERMQRVEEPAPVQQKANRKDW
jgi:Ca-activated chloride channel family protein